MVKAKIIYLGGPGGRRTVTTEYDTLDGLFLFVKNRLQKTDEEIRITFMPGEISTGSVSGKSITEDLI